MCRYNSVIETDRSQESSDEDGTPLESLTWLLRDGERTTTANRPKQDVGKSLVAKQENGMWGTVVALNWRVRARQGLT